MRAQILSTLASAVLLALSGSAYAGGGHHQQPGHPMLAPSADASVVNDQTSGGCKGNCGGNKGFNLRNDNTSGINGSFGGGVSGNVGANAAAGDSNVQSNNASLAALDADFITSGDTDTAAQRGAYQPAHPAPLTFASVDASVESTQMANGNETKNYGNQNTASIKDSFSGAGGNVGVNVASGSGNVQANSLAAAVADITSTQMNITATTDNSQTSSGNIVHNEGLVETKVVEYADVSLDLSATGAYEGTGEETRGRPDHHGGHDKKGGGYHDDHGDKKFTFEESGEIGLEGSVTGKIPVVNTYASRDNFNKATISDGSFNGATGNIGVNMASGSNNLQANNLTLSAGSSK